MGDSYAGLIAITQKNIETSKNAIKGYMEDLKESTNFVPQVWDLKLFNETEWKDAGTKIGNILANGAVDTFEEKATLKDLKDKFVQEGDKARADFMDHVINGDWSIPQLQAKAKRARDGLEYGF